MRSLDLRPGSSYLVGAGSAAVSNTYGELVSMLEGLVTAAHGDAR
jgi:hypothetical protein